eukprot:scaffold56522_cov59-Attheya_sp.AAC.5
MNADVNEVVDYRIRFRAPNKPNTNKLGVRVYDSIEEEVVAPDFFASFMADVNDMGLVSKDHSSLTPTMQTLRRLYNHNKNKHFEESEGFVFCSKVDKQMTGRVTPEMIGVLLATRDSFDTCNMRGNLTSKIMSTYRFSEMVDPLVEHMFDNQHPLYEENTVSNVCAIIVEKEEVLKSNRSFMKVVAALIQWTSDGAEVSNEKDSSVRADLYAVTLYDKRGLYVQLTHRCLKTLYKCSIDIQRRLTNKAKRLQNGEEVQKIPTVYKIDNFGNEMTGNYLMDDNSVARTSGHRARKGAAIIKNKGVRQLKKHQCAYYDPPPVLVLGIILRKAQTLEQDSILRQNTSSLARSRLVRLKQKAIRLTYKILEIRSLRRCTNVNGWFFSYIQYARNLDYVSITTGRKVSTKDDRHDVRRNVSRHRPNDMSPRLYSR